MNTGNKLYRSTSEAMLGGVAAGLGNYLKIDVNVMRLLFVLAAFITAGTFVLVYVVLWLLLPTAASTAHDTGGVIQENLNEMGNRLRGFTSAGPAQPGNGQGNAAPAAPGAGGTAPNGQPAAGYGPGQQPSRGIITRTAPSNVALLLIGLGVLFLLMNVGFFSLFRIFQWGGWWPLLLIVLGAILLMRRR